MSIQGYYYTICSLPSPSFTNPPPLTTTAFLSLCEIEVCHKDMHTLKTISLLPSDTPPPLPSIGRWYEWEQQLRQELAIIRAAAVAKLGWGDFKIKIREESSFPQKDLAAMAIAMESPSEAEDLLDLARWQFLSELETVNYFGLQKLSLYFLKLQLLKRRAMFSQPAGQKVRQEILNRVHLPK